MPVPGIPVYERHPAIVSALGLLQLEMDRFVVGVDRGLADRFVVTGRALECLHASVPVKEIIHVVK